ncbi:MAG: metal-sulfur cluster assembly factor [Bacteroidales bacterium]|nr:metal-sulfur cluster assembly factor [Bacteroidales bacterium]
MQHLPNDHPQTGTPKPTQDTIHHAVVDVLRSIFDPEIPVNIFDLGLIYNIDVKEEGDGFKVAILMTMTAPDCPEAEFMYADVKQMVGYISGVKDVDVQLTFDPPWTPDRLTDEVKIELGLL